MPLPPMLISYVSGNIRNIQQYEQGANDIRKAGFDGVEALTNAPASV